MIERSEAKHGLIQEGIDAGGSEDNADECGSGGISRRSVSQHLKNKRLCFVCNSYVLLRQRKPTVNGLFHY